VSLAGVEEQAAEVYAQLNAAGIEVLWDDRDVSAGVKFGDADLLGIPVRLVISKRTQDKLEWKRRDSDASELVDLQEALVRLKLTINSGEDDLPIPPTPKCVLYKTR